jgi:ribosomal protein S18 acetylase RimI-like enzyme
MSIDQVEICSGLPDGYRSEAAELYCEAFRQKLAPLVGTQERGIALLEKTFDPGYAIVALHQDKCVGIAGLQYSGHSFIRPRFSAFVQELGWLRGLLGCVGFRAFDPSPRQGELRIECLAVASLMRGQGIGTLLLRATDDLARAKGFRAVSLEVVDANPDARRLYERQGFVPRRTLHCPCLRRITGFSAATVMVKKIETRSSELI